MRLTIQKGIAKKRAIDKNNIASIDKILYNKLYNIDINRNKKIVNRVSNDSIRFYIINFKIELMINFYN